MDDNLLNILQKQTEVATRTEQKVDDMHDRLFGNGQPGSLQVLQTSIKKHEEEDERIQKDLADRLASLNTSRQGDRKWLAGAFAVITVEGAVIAFYFKYVYSILHNILVK